MDDFGRSRNEPCPFWQGEKNGFSQLAQDDLALNQEKGQDFIFQEFHDDDDQVDQHDDSLLSYSFGNDHDRR
jgi:hypothetical protein